MEVIEDIALVVQSILTMLAILIGAGWSFWKYVLQRESHPKIQFDIDVNFISIQDNQILFEVLLILENKGIVRHQIDKENFTLKIRFLTKNDKINQGVSKYNYETKFPNLHNVLDDSLIIEDKIKRKVIPESWENTYLDPGITQKFSYVTALPDDTICFLIKSKFNYSGNKNDNRGAKKIFKVDNLIRK